MQHQPTSQHPGLNDDNKTVGFSNRYIEGW